MKSEGLYWMYICSCSCLTRLAFTCSPMARGMLTGKLDLKNLPDGDFRKTGYNPQFNEDNVDGVKL